MAEAGTRDAFGHAQLGGVGPLIATLVKDRLNYKYHWAVADYLQRAARHLASKTDVAHSYAVGKAAVELALAGRNAVMPAITRASDKPYRWKIAEAPLAEVANVEKMLPRDFITTDGYGITAEGARVPDAADARRGPAAVQGRPAAVRAAEERRRGQEACRRIRDLTRNGSCAWQAVVDYYFATISPWAYLGHDRFVAMARKHGATVAVKPVNLGEVFPVSGGLPLSKRAPQRQAYRLVELARWSQFLGKPMNVQPAFFPVNGDLAAYWILAANELGWPQALALAGAVGRAHLGTGARHRGRRRRCRRSPASADCLRPSWPRVRKPRISRSVTRRSRRRRSTAACSGRPPTSLHDELFWGQDRLDFLDRKLAK